MSNNKQKAATLALVALGGIVTVFGVSSFKQDRDTYSQAGTVTAVEEAPAKPAVSAASAAAQDDGAVEQTYKDKVLEARWQAQYKALGQKQLNK